jgi:hypothetical protein
MKNPTHAGVEQDENAQLALDQGSLLIVGWALCNHPTDSQAAEPTLQAIPSALGTPEAAALESGYIGPARRLACAKRGIEPSIATGRASHHPRGPQRFASLPDPPAEDANAPVKMAYKLRTALGQAIDGAGKCTLEPVIGIIKEVLGLRQFSLRGIAAAAGEWCLVCLAFNLKGFHTGSGAERGHGGIFPGHWVTIADPVLPATACCSGACAPAVNNACTGRAAGINARPFSPTSC